MEEVPFAPTYGKFPEEAARTETIENSQIENSSSLENIFRRERLEVARLLQNENSEIGTPKWDQRRIAPSCSYFFLGVRSSSCTVFAASWASCEKVPRHYRGKRKSVPRRPRDTHGE